MSTIDEQEMIEINLKEEQTLVDKLAKTKEDLENRIDFIQKQKVKAEQIRVAKLSAAKAAKEHQDMLVGVDNQLMDAYNKLRPLMSKEITTEQLFMMLCALIISVPKETILPGMLFMPPEIINVMTNFVEVIGNKGGK